MALEKKCRTSLLFEQLEFVNQSVDQTWGKRPKNMKLKLMEETFSSTHTSNGRIERDVGVDRDSKNTEK